MLNIKETSTLATIFSNTQVKVNKKVQNYVYKEKLKIYCS